MSYLVKAILDCEEASAARRIPSACRSVSDRGYPRPAAGEEVDSRACARNGALRVGRILKAQRLKPDAIDIRVDVNPVHWFLNDRLAMRSSYYLEDAATEFQVQGLELDWACVAWDGDLRFSGAGWKYHSFRGNRWCKIGKAEAKRYLCNAYRVLLTRARQGMVIYVPTGDEGDPTRSPAFYDATYEYLSGIGIPELS